jgi:hypothetical protein
MSNVFKRMQKLAGLITESMDETNIGETTLSSKMKKSELKAQIKEMILAEMTDKEEMDEVDYRELDSYDQADSIQQMYKKHSAMDEAKKKKKEADIPPADDLDLSAEEDNTDLGPDMGADLNPDMGAEPQHTDVQKELTDALEAAKTLGDEKLVRQIGNALTYFTRTQVSSEEAPAMN